MFERKRDGLATGVVFLFFLLNIKLFHPNSKVSWRRLLGEILLEDHILETSHGWVTLMLSWL